MLAQCKKKDISYKTIAIESAGDIIESLQVDIFSDLWGILPINIPVSSCYCVYLSTDFILGYKVSEEDPRFFTNGREGGEGGLIL